MLQLMIYEITKHQCSLINACEIHKSHMILATTEKICLNHMQTYSITMNKKTLENLDNAQNTVCYKTLFDTFAHAQLSVPTLQQTV